MVRIITEKSTIIEDLISKLFENTEQDMYDWQAIEDNMFGASFKNNDQTKDVCVYRDANKTIFLISKELEAPAWAFKDQISDINKAMDDNGIDFKDIIQDSMELVYIVPVVTVRCGTGAMIKDDESSGVLNLVNAASRYAYRAEQKRLEQAAFERDKALKKYVNDFEKFI